MLPKPMRASNFRCLLCGQPLGLSIATVRLGPNSGACPQCGEPFTVKLDREDMEQLLEAEEYGDAH